MLDGEIRLQPEEGVVLGWLRSADSDRPRIALLVPDGMAPLRVVADGFRPDLFENGEGHGHYGFLARLDLPAGGALRRILLVDEATRTPVSETVFGGGGPAMRREAPLGVEELIDRPAKWTTRQLATHAGNLCIEETLATLGPRAFVERAARYVFGREPDRGGLAPLVEALSAGRLTGIQAFRTLIETAETLAGGPQDLPGAHDGLYPFFREAPAR